MGQPIVAAAAFQAASPPRKALDQGNCSAVRARPAVTGVLFYVSLDSSKFKFRLNKMIVAFILPEGLPDATQNPIGLVCAESLKRTEPLWRSDARRHQHMNMVWHHRVRMQLIPAKPLFPSTQRRYHHIRDLGLSEEKWSCAGPVQQSVHGYEGFAAGQPCRRENPATRQAVV